MKATDQVYRTVRKDWRIHSGLFTLPWCGWNWHLSGLVSNTRLGNIGRKFHYTRKRFCPMWCYAGCRRADNLTRWVFVDGKRWRWHKNSGCTTFIIRWWWIVIMEDCIRLRLWTSYNLILYVSKTPFPFHSMVRCGNFHRHLLPQGRFCTVSDSDWLNLNRRATSSAFSCRRMAMALRISRQSIVSLWHWA